jgi:hypothetical protein
MTKTETQDQNTRRATAAGQGASLASAAPRIIPAGRPVPRRLGAPWRPLYIGVIGA